MVEHSSIANRFKREELRLWLYRCNWGRGAIAEWEGEEGHLKQMQALLEILQRPTVIGRVLSRGGGSTPREWLGFWVQIQVPSALAGKELIVQPSIPLRRSYIDKFFNVREPENGGRRTYNQFLDGNWVDPKLLGALPDGPGSHLHTADFTYPTQAQHRLWQVWVETDMADPTLELEINYPPDAWQRSDGRGYMFRLAMQWAANEADRVNEACSNELPEEEGAVLSNQRTQLLILRVPQSSDR